uniref:FERM domain-containing protein n=1 Tax=Setaria digitata TaxID=48799 RepID=A0A915PIB3_9BILA
MQQHNLSQTDARAYFLEVLEKWPYFGTTFFYVHNIIDESRQTGECLLAINKYGIKVINIKDHEEIFKITLAEILSTNRYTTEEGIFLDIQIGNQQKHKNITIYTEQGIEISRLLGQYIYVDSENRAFITGIEQQELRI